MTLDCSFAKPLEGAEAGVLAEAVERCTEEAQTFKEVPKQERGRPGSVARCYVFDASQAKCGEALATTTSAAGPGDGGGSRADAPGGEGATQGFVPGATPSQVPRPGATGKGEGGPTQEPRPGTKEKEKGEGGAPGGGGGDGGGDGVARTCASPLEVPCDTGGVCYKRKFKCDGGTPDCPDESDETTKACREKNGGAAADDGGAGRADAAGGANGPSAGGSTGGDTGEDADGGGGGGGSIMPLVGGVVGAVALVLAVIVYVYYTAKHRKERKAAAAHGSDSANTHRQSVAVAVAGVDAAAGAGNFNITVRNRVFDPSVADTRADGDVDGELYHSQNAGQAASRGKGTDGAGYVCCSPTLPLPHRRRGVAGRPRLLRVVHRARAPCGPLVVAALPRPPESRGELGEGRVRVCVCVCVCF